MKRSYQICIGVTITLIVLGIVVGVVVGIVLRPKEQTISQEDYCAKNPAQCSTVRSDVRDFIFSRHQQEDSIVSLMQFSEKLEELETVNDENKEEVYPKVFQKAIGSLECMNFLFNENDFDIEFSGLEDLYTQTEQSALRYLQMVVEGNTNPISPSSDERLQNACNFTQTRRRRLQSSDNSTQCYERNAILHFVNGVDYSLRQSMKNMNKIRSILESHPELNFNAGIQVIGPWRKGNRPVGDMITTIKMKFLQNNIASTTWSVIRQIISYTTRSIPGLNLAIIAAQITLEAMNLYADIDRNFNVNNHVSMVQGHIREGKKVVIVGHSQGSLYSNHIYRSLTQSEKTSVRMAFVGPAAGQMADDPSNSNYMSYEDDKVIHRWLNYIGDFLMLNDPLPANINSTSNTNFADQDYHDFVGYLNSFPDRFVEIVQHAYDNAVVPSASESSGPITVQLTWDDKPDIDLHIFQPNGAHVYYGSRYGISGYLDRDDTSSYGPQHYYTSCDRLQLGTYIVGYNYYRGSGHSNIMAKINAGSKYEIKTFTSSDQNGIGSVGDSSPNFICTIVVGWNQNGRFFTYQIN